MSFFRQSVPGVHIFFKLGDGLFGIRKKSILLVEDSILTRFSSKRLLESKGYEVKEAISGEEALVKSKESLDPFGLVIVEKRN